VIAHDDVQPVLASGGKCLQQGQLRLVLGGDQRGQPGHFVDTTSEIGAIARARDVRRRLPKFEHVTDDHQFGAVVADFEDLVQEALERLRPAEIFRCVPSPARVFPDSESGLNEWSRP
jgi:hypothetical protein